MAKKVSKSVAGHINISVPYLLGVDEPRYCSPRIDLSLLHDPALYNTLRALFNAMDKGGARLRNGRVVGGTADVIRFILEQVTAGIARDCPATGAPEKSESSEVG